MCGRKAANNKKNQESLHKIACFSLKGGGFSVKGHEKEERLYRRTLSQRHTHKTVCKK